MASSISLRLTEEIAQQLEEVSKETQRTKSFIIKAALKQYLDDFSDYQIALDRLKDKDDAILSSKELRKRIGI